MTADNKSDWKQYSKLFQEVFREQRQIKLIMKKIKDIPQWDKKTDEKRQTTSNS